MIATMRMAMLTVMIMAMIMRIRMATLMIMIMIMAVIMVMIIVMSMNDHDNDDDDDDDDDNGKNDDNENDNSNDSYYTENANAKNYDKYKHHQNYNGNDYDSDKHDDDSFWDPHSSAAVAAAVWRFGHCCLFWTLNGLFSCSVYGRLFFALQGFFTAPKAWPLPLQAPMSNAKDLCAIPPLKSSRGRPQRRDLRACAAERVSFQPRARLPKRNPSSQEGQGREENLQGAKNTQAVVVVVVWWSSS